MARFRASLPQGRAHQSFPGDPAKPNRDVRRSGRKAVNDWNPNAWVQTASHRVPVLVYDISLDGAGFEAVEPIGVGDVISLCVTTPAEMPPIECVVVRQTWMVPRLDQLRYRHGARFIDPDTRKIKAIADSL